MPTFSERLRSVCVDTAARQWKALGVALAGETHVGDGAIDPEALILFTAALGDADARVRDESMDWCVQHGDRLISTSRLRNIRNLLPPESSDRVDTYIATVNEHGRTRWPVHSDSIRARDLSPSGKSVLPRLGKSIPLLRLQLRALFGVTARAEVILALSVGEARKRFQSASELSSTGYSKRNVALVLEDLALCELVTTKRLGNRVGYRLDAGARLATLAPAIRGASMVRWDRRLALLIAASVMVDRVEKKKPVLRSVEARRFATAHTDDFDALAMTVPDVEDPETYFEVLVTWALEELAD
jgi:hypothetical protein